MKLCDTSAIIFFLKEIPEVNCINHLCYMREDLNISEEVYDEYHEDSLGKTLISRSDSITLDEYIEEDKIKLLIMEIGILKDKIKRRYPTLGQGELSIIALGLLMQEEHVNYSCVLDDGIARSAAAKYNLDLTGSIGLLIHIRDNNGWDNEKMECIINKIRLSDFRVSEKVLRRLLW